MLASVRFEPFPLLLHAAWALPVLAGCAFWFFWLGAAALIQRRLPEIGDLEAPPPGAWPRVSVIAPAKDEIGTLEAATRARLADGYPNLQAVLVDDRSTDGTGALVDRLADADPRVVACHVRELPEGWLGKNHALQVGTAAATGEWLLFTDADVHFAPDTLRRVVAWAEAEGADFVCVMPGVPVRGFLLTALIVTFSRMFSLSQRLWAVADPHSDAFVGVGAFNLVRRRAYERTPGWEALRLDVADDVALGKLMKESGAACRVLRGIEHVTVEWYTSLGALAHGFEKNSFVMLGGRLRRVILAVAVVTWCELAPWIAVIAGLVVGGPLVWLAVVGGLALLAGLAANTGMAVKGRMAWLPAVCSPVGTALFAWVLLRAGWIGRRAGAVTWRGTSYPLELLRENQFLLRKPGDKRAGPPSMSCPR